MYSILLLVFVMMQFADRMHIDPCKVNIWIELDEYFQYNHDWSRVCMPSHPYGPQLLVSLLMAKQPSLSHALSLSIDSLCAAKRRARPLPAAYQVLWRSRFASHTSHWRSAGLAKREATAAGRRLAPTRKPPAAAEEGLITCTSKVDPGKTWRWSICPVHLNICGRRQI